MDERGEKHSSELTLPSAGRSEKDRRRFRERKSTGTIIYKKGGSDFTLYAVTHTEPRVSGGSKAGSELTSCIPNTAPPPSHE